VRPFSVTGAIRSAVVVPREFNTTGPTVAAPEDGGGASSSRMPDSWSSQGSDRLK
jgi:hypothetical protein